MVRRITWRTSDIVRILLLVALFIFAWQFFWMVINAFFLALLAVLLAIIFHAPARFLSRWIPFALAFPIVLLTFLGIGAALVVAMVPQLISQVTQLAVELPRAVGAIVDWVEEGPLGRFAEFQNLPNQVAEQLGEFVGRFVPFAVNLIAALVGGIAVIVLAIFLAVQPGVYRDLVIRIAPVGSRDKVIRIYDEAGRNLRNWVIGKACTMLAVGVLVYIGLLLFGIPGALALAALAAVLEFIPNFGPTIAAIPAVIAAFLISPLTALWVTVFYIVLQQVQSAVTVPLVERRAVNIPPAALLIWQIMLTIGFGFLGLFVATPLLAILVVAGRILYLEPAEARAAWDRREMGPSVEPPVIAEASPASPSPEGPAEPAPDLPDPGES